MSATTATFAQSGHLSLLIACRPVAGGPNAFRMKEAPHCARQVCWEEVFEVGAPVPLVDSSYTKV
jgi:hypothetical protein